MSSSGVSSCTLFDEECLCLKGFNISFSWDYPDNWCLKDVKDTVFHLLDANAPTKPDSAALIQTVQSSGSEVLLTEPNPERDVIPCELHLKAHPDSLQFCITNILVVSEAKHIELYVNDMYEKTSKGCILNLKKGKKCAIYENQVDLSAHIQGTQKVTLKFLSLPDKKSMRLQAIALTIVECANSAPKKAPTATDMPAVRDMLKTLNLSVNDSAEKLMNDIEMQQKQNQLLLFQNLLQAGNVNTQQIYNMMSQPSVPQNIISSLLPSGNNNTMLPPNGLITNIPSGEQHCHLQTDSDYCLHSSQHSCNSLIASSNRDSLDNVISKSYPGSRTLSPNPSCMHLSNHLSVCRSSGTVLNRCSCLPQSGCCGNQCFGVPNPPNESVLANAILNERPSREHAKNRISMIEHDNFHQAQIELQREYRQSVCSDPASGSVRLRHPSSQCTIDRKRKARSLCTMPTESERDFSHLLAEIIKDESKDGRTKILVDHADDLGSDPNTTARWKSYLRSRVRASQRYSMGLSSNDSDVIDHKRDSNYQDYDSVIGLDEASQCSNQDVPSCKKCGCSGCHNVYETISKNISSMEQKLLYQVDQKIEDLRRHLDKRLDHILEVINLPQPYDYDENLCSNTEV